MKTETVSMEGGVRRAKLILQKVFEVSAIEQEQTGTSAAGTIKLSMWPTSLFTLGLLFYPEDGSFGTLVTI
jgi:hypothetical protein